MRNRAVDLRLVDPDIEFWVDARLVPFDGSWLAVADIVSAPEMAAAARADLALLLALWPLGDEVARRLTAVALLESDILP